MINVSNQISGKNQNINKNIEQITNRFELTLTNLLADSPNSAQMISQLTQPPICTYRPLSMCYEVSEIKQSMFLLTGLPIKPFEHNPVGMFRPYTLAYEFVYGTVASIVYTVASNSDIVDDILSCNAVLNLEDRFDELQDLVELFMIEDLEHLTKLAINNNQIAKDEKQHENCE